MELFTLVGQLLPYGQNLLIFTYGNLFDKYVEIVIKSFNIL
jgi:hypothetical protein